jgi:hypothetical protein
MCIYDICVYRYIYIYLEKDQKYNKIFLVEKEPHQIFVRILGLKKLTITFLTTFSFRFFTS